MLTIVLTVLFQLHEYHQKGSMSSIKDSMYASQMQQHYY